MIMAQASTEKVVMSFYERLKHAHDLVEEGQHLVRRTHRNVRMGNACVAHSYKLLMETRGRLPQARH
jgi:hypothetical protein